MAIRWYIIGLVLACIVGGLTTTGLISRANHEVELKQESVSSSSVLVGELLRFEDLFKQWMLLGDLVIGSDQTYIADGAKELGTRLQELLDRIDSSRSGDSSSQLLAVISDFVERQQDRLDRAVAIDVGGDERQMALDRLLGEVDNEAGATLIALEAIHLRVDEALVADKNALQLADQRRDVWTIVAFSGFIAWIVCLWAGTTRVISRPLCRLRDEALAARAENRRLHIESIGPLEVHDLSQSFGELVGQLEDAVAERTEHLAETNAELAAALVEAQKADQAKSDFLANMSHEIRTPMTAILGFSDVLAENIEDEEYKDVVGTIHRNGHHLMSIINDILDLSKLEAGKMDVERIECSPWQIAYDVIDLMKLEAGNKGLALAVEHVGPIPRSIVSDPKRLRQILVNLVGNAIKFTEDGGVRVIVRLVEDSECAEPRIRFEVMDTGIGMSTAQAERVFNAFEQADCTMARKFGGTGLGLTITRHLVGLLDGAIELTSESGRGTTVLVTVATGSIDGVELLDDPERERAQQASRVGSKTVDIEGGLNGICMLVCEDGEDNQRLIRRLLENAGADVTIMENGKLGIDAVRGACDRGQPFDIILMDMQMPVMGGYEATTLLREQGYGGPIVALTAHAMASDRQKCLDAGCDDYCSKPIDLGALFRTIRRLCASKLSAIENAAPSGESTLESEVTPPQPRIDATDTSPKILQEVRVLVCEDGQDNQRLIRFHLQKAGADVTIMENGKLGLDAALAARDEGNPYDVIIMDMQMPVMGGYEATSLLRKHGYVYPIVALTAHALPEDRQKCLDAGCDDYDTKPIHGQRVIELVRSWAERGRNMGTTDENVRSAA